MNPELANKLMKLPEGRALKEYLLSEANKLNRLDDIKLTDPDEIALETLTRQRAYETVKKMLSTVFDTDGFDIMNEKDDSISTEMLQQERSQDSNQE